MIPIDDHDDLISSQCDRIFELESQRDRLAAALRDARVIFDMVGIIANIEPENITVDTSVDRRVIVGITLRERDRIDSLLSEIPQETPE